MSISLQNRSLRNVWDWIAGVILCTDALMIHRMKTKYRTCYLLLCVSFQAGGSYLLTCCTLYPLVKCLDLSLTMDEVLCVSMMTQLAKV